MIKQSSEQVRRVYVGILALTVSGFGFAQTTLTLSPGSGSPGGVVNLSLSLSSSTPPAALQWTLAYSTSDFSAVNVTAGTAATAAGKSVSCNTTAGNQTCALWGMNSTTISNGVIANIALTIANTSKTSSAVQVNSSLASSSAGVGITSSATGATVTITQTAPTFTISGTISPTAGGSGATVILSGTSSATTTANSSGAYTFSGLANGSYTVTPSNIGYTFTPPSVAVTVSSANQTANFTASPVVTLGVTSVVCNPDAVVPPATSTCQVVISGPAPSGGTNVTVSGNSPNVFVPSNVNIPQGSTTSSFVATTTAVTTITKVPVTAAVGTSSAGFFLTLLPQPASNGIAVDATVSLDSPSPTTSVTSSTFSPTTSGNELLLAFVSAGGAAANTVSNVTGAGLTWVRAIGTNSQPGTSEIWRAFATTILTNVSVTATLTSSAYSSLTVMSFTGVDPSGTNGSGAIGATANGSAGSGAPTASLATTRDGSLVVGVGNDTSSGTVALPAAGQNIVHQVQTANANTYWVQQQINPTPVSGTTVSINDTAPSSDRYNLSALEILPPSTCVVTLIPQTRSFTTSGGSSTVVVADGGGCSWTATTDSPTWISLNGSTGTGNGSFVFNVAINIGQTRMGTITVGSQSFKVMESGAVQIFTDVLSATQYFDYMNMMYIDGITAGCIASPLQYCPTSPVTRDEMAVFVVSAIDHINHRAGGLPASYTQTPYFQDEPPSDGFFPFVQRLADLGLTDGCQASPPLYCPQANITQDQMAKFMIIGWMRVNNLTTFTYSTTAYFTDVPVGDYFFPYVQKMRDMGFWFGCSSTSYCRSNPVLRSDMAALVMRSLLGAP